MQAIELARSIKALQPQLPIIVGGAGPSAYPLFHIRDTAIDFVITGEAEISVIHFLHSLINQTLGFEQVPNLYWKESQRIKNSPLTGWTHESDISVVFSECYARKKNVSLTTSLTRGCSKQCAFCSQGITHGQRFRTASIDRVKQAINNLPQPSQFQGLNLTINFEDDNILLDRRYFNQVIETLKDKYKTFSIVAENGIDYSLLTPELVDYLAAAGMAQFNLSIASHSAIIAEKEKRHLEIRLYQSIIQAIAKHSIPAITYFICGFKDDTKESIVDTLVFLASQPTLIGISMYYAVPGIANFNDLRKFDDLPPYLCCGSSAYPWNGSLSTQTMITAFRLSRYCNLMKQSMHSELEKEILRMIRTSKKLFTFVKSKNGIHIQPVENCDDELVKMFFSRLC